MGRPSDREGGFTLLELVVVLFIAGMIAAVVLPSFSGTLESARLRAGAADVRATLSFARALSAGQARERDVMFDLASGEYAVAGNDKRRLPEGVQVRSVRVGDVVVERDRLAADAPPARVRFFPDGSAWEAEVVLASAGGGTLRVVVEPLTGSVSAGT